MKDYIASLIRTYVPVVVASVVAFLAQVGLILPDDATTALATVLGGLVGAIYYAVVRWAETRWPKLGLLLGSAKTPTYTDAGQ